MPLWELLIELHGSGEVLVSTELAATIIAPDGRIVVDRSLQMRAPQCRSAHMVRCLERLLRIVEVPLNLVTDEELAKNPIALKTTIVVGVKTVP